MEGYSFLHESLWWIFNLIMPQSQGGEHSILETKEMYLRASDATGKGCENLSRSHQTLTKTTTRVKGESRVFRSTQQQGLAFIDLFVPTPTSTSSANSDSSGGANLGVKRYLSYQTFSWSQLGTYLPGLTQITFTWILHHFWVCPLHFGKGHTGVSEENRG